MAATNILTIQSISDFHKLRGLGAPKHPLVSVVKVEDFVLPVQRITQAVMMNFYSISIKRNCGAIKYGRTNYDYDTGVMYFVAPGQLFTVSHDKEDHSQTGRILLVHPDLLWNTPLAEKINQYEYFGYSVNEALWVSMKEEAIILDIFKNIQEEASLNLDKYSKQIIVSQVESLLSYCERFYNRQFITRQKSHHEILTRLEKLLNQYFDSEDLSLKGPPSVPYIADKLHISSNYLSSLLRIHTGFNTQQHIQQKLIQKAKQQLSTSQLTITEIAYELGFEHQQSFSKLFKKSTQLTPKAFRNQFKLKE